MTSPFAGYQQSLAYSAAKDRLIIGAMAAHGIGLTPSDGVLLGGGAGTNFDVTFNTLQVTVSAGVAMVAGYTVVVPAAQTVNLTAGGGTVRRDLVILRVYDTESGDPSSQVKVEVVQGTGPTDPAIPARSLVLYQVDMQVGASAISVWSDRRKFTSAAGGIRQAYQIADLAVQDVAQGSMVYALASQRMYRRDGSAFTTLTKVGSGGAGPDIYGCWNVANFDGNGLWYMSWSSINITWSTKPSVTAMAANTTIGADAGVDIGIYHPHNDATTLVLSAHYTKDGRSFNGSLDITIMAMGTLA